MVTRDSETLKYTDFGYQHELMLPIGHRVRQDEEFFQLSQK